MELHKDAPIKLIILSPWWRRKNGKFLIEKWEGEKSWDSIEFPVISVLRCVYLNSYTL